MSDPILVPVPQPAPPPFVPGTPKQPLSSTTILFNILTVAAIALTAMTGNADKIPPEWMPFIIGALGIVNILLRFNTNQGISFAAPPTVPTASTISTRTAGLKIDWLHIVLAILSGLGIGHVVSQSRTLKSEAQQTNSAKSLTPTIPTTP